MFALFSRILKLSDHYKSRIQGAFVCAFLESILSKMPIFLAFVVLSGFANKTITGQTCLYVLLGKQVLYTARQEGRVLTLDVPDCAATFRTTIQDMKTLMNQGVSTLVLTTEKGSTTLNLSLLCEGQTDTQRVVLRQLGDSAFLTVGLRCRRDLIVGR